MGVLLWWGVEGNTVSMSDRIKLENIHTGLFDRQTGDEKTVITTEYKCSNCHHLVRQQDQYCWRCGESIQDSALVEHWHKSKVLNEAQFQQAKTMSAKDLKNVWESLPEVNPPRKVRI